MTNNDILSLNAKVINSSNKLFLGVLFVLALQYLTGCDNGTSMQSVEHISTNSEENSSGFEDYLLAKNLTDIDDTEKSALKTQFLERVELAEKIENKNVVAKDVLNAEVADFRRELLIKMYLEELAQNSVDEQLLKKYYEENIDKYSTAMANISHILLGSGGATAGNVDPNERAKMIIGQIQQGADFGLLAKEYSIDIKTANQNGAMGWVDLSKIDAAMAQVIQSMQPGGISQPTTTVFGVHIIKLHESPKISKRSFDSVKEQIRHDVTKALYFSELEKLKEL